MSHASVVLYGLEYSVYTRIARLALLEKAVPHLLETVEIFGPQGVPEEHLERHPFGRIPVLRHRHFELYETTAITRYVDEAFPGSVLQPSRPEERARMNQIIGLLDAYGYHPMVWGVFVRHLEDPSAGTQPNGADLAHQLATARKCLSALDRLQSQESCLVGESLTLADLHAYPMLCYVALVPEGKTLLGEFPTLARWFEVMHQRPSVKATRTKYESQG